MATFAQRTTNLTLWGADKTTNNTTVSLDDSITTQPILKFGSGTGTNTEVLFDADNVSFLVSGSAKTLVAERDERIAAEVQNSTDITTEAARALAAEAVNTGLVASEATTARAAEASNADAIASEISRAVGVETAAAEALAQEIVDRAAGDSASINALNAYKIMNNGSVTTNANSIAAEITRATEAEAINALAIHAVDKQVMASRINTQVALDEHAAEVTNEFVTVTAALNMQGARLTGVEDHFNSVLNDETTRALAAEAAIEASAAANAASIASLIGTSPEELNQLEELVADYTANGATVQSNVDVLEARIALLETWVMELAGGTPAE